MILETKRLYIRAMKPDELIKYSEGLNPFDDLNLTFSNFEIDEALKPVLLKTIIPNVKINKDEYLFFTLWLLIEKRFIMSVGSISFKGKPASDGKVEIGYGVHEEFQNKGYMTEAVEAIKEWAFSTGRIKEITAETEKDNTASFTVLEDNGFIRYKENEKLYYWKTVKK